MICETRLSSICGIATIVAIALLAALAPARAGERDAILIMVEQTNCEWCAAWNQEIAPTYPKTWEGRSARLRRIDLHDPPDDLSGLNLGRYTPTFILMVDGKESGRIRGYPGEDFFWGLLDDLLSDAGLTEENAPPKPES